MSPSLCVLHAGKLILEVKKPCSYDDYVRISECYNSISLPPLKENQIVICRSGYFGIVLDAKGIASDEDFVVLEMDQNAPFLTGTDVVVAIASSEEKKKWRNEFIDWLDVKLCME